MRTDRITQLVSKYIAMAAVAVAVAVFPEVSEEEKLRITDIAGTIAAGLVALAGLFIDYAIHRMNNGGFLKAPKAGGTVAPADVKKG